MSIRSRASRAAELMSPLWQLSPLAAASSISILNSVVIAVAYARLAGPAPYGVYQLVFAVVGVVAIAALSGSPTAAMRAAAQGRPAAWPLFVARLPFAIATALLLAVGAAVVAFAGRGTIAAALAAAAVTLPLLVGADVFPAQLVGQRRYRAYLAFQSAVQILVAATVVAAVAAAPDAPWLAVLVTSALTGALQFGGLLSERRAAQSTEEDVSFARRLSAIAVLSAVDARLDILVAGALLGAREVGLVAVARTLPTIVKRIWEVLYQPFFVRMSAVPATDAYRIAQRFRLPLVLTLGGASAAAALLAPWLLPAVFGGAFAPAVALAQLLLLSNVLLVVGFLDEIFLKARGDVRRLSAIYVILPVTSLIALPPLIHVFGIVGIGIEALLVAVIYVAAVTPLARAGLVAAESR